MDPPMRLRQQMQSMRFAIMNWVTKTSLLLFPRYAVEEGRIYFLAARTDQRIANPEVREEREVGCPLVRGELYEPSSWSRPAVALLR